MSPNDAARTPSAAVAPTWWVVFLREFTDLWVGGKGLTLVLVYSVLLGLWSYVMASNTELSLIPPKEMVWEMLEASISVGSFICLVAAAETISGDRERGALEALLLTPTRRRQLVMGKFLAMFTLWPAVLAVTIPYLAVLAKGTDILVPATLWGTLTGTIIVSAITALGMIISLYSNSLKNSMFVSFGLFILIFMPFALPGHAQTGPMGLLLQLLSPLMATYDFLAKVLVNNRALTDKARPVGDLLVWHHLISPVVFSLFMLTVLFFTSPSLSIEARRPRWLGGRRALGWLAVLGLLGAGGVSTARAEEPLTDAVMVVRPTLELAIDKTVAQVGQGDSILYKTTVTNHGTEPSHPLTLAMNIINLDSKGDIVDPEDWSPQRTQYVDQLAPGASTTHSWRVNAIMDGDYMLYMVAIPKPDRPEATSEPAASHGVHLTISPRVKLNPKGILLYVVGTPIALLLGMLYIRNRRRQATEQGGSD